MGGCDYKIMEKFWRTESGLYALVMYFDGHRCGYVRLPDDHWARHIDDTDIINTDVHGGITYSGENPTLPRLPAFAGYWLGFDCNHYNDAKCPDWIKENGWPPAREGAIHRTLDYCVEQCELLASELSKEPMFESAQQALGVIRDHYTTGLDNGVDRAIVYLDNHLREHAQFTASALSMLKQHWSANMGKDE